MKKLSFTFLVLMLFTLTGLFLIATRILPADELKKNNSSQQNQKNNYYPLSEEFKEIEFQLLNSANILNIPNKIERITDTFEKKYLTALYKKRKGDFNSAFHQLFSILSTQPAHYKFYDELIFLAKASDNLGKIKKIS